MSKPTTYRGIPYTIAKGPSLRRYISSPVWHGVVSLRDESERFERLTKRETVEALERAIDIHLDYDGDHRLYGIVENLVRELTQHDEKVMHLLRGEEPRRIPPTVGELRKRLHRVCEIAERILITRYADSDRAATIEKLRAMTVANGCTEAEAANARAMLKKLEAV